MKIKQYKIFLKWFSSPCKSIIFTQKCSNEINTHTNERNKYVGSRWLEMQEAALLPAAKNREFADCWFLIWGMPTGNSPMDRLMTKQANVCLTNAKVLISTVSYFKENRKEKKKKKEYKTKNFFKIYWKWRILNYGLSFQEKFMKDHYVATIKMNKQDIRLKENGKFWIHAIDSEFVEGINLLTVM